MTFRDIYDMIDALAPFSTQMDFDNSGLLAGHPDREITGIHVALDVTHRVLDEAEAAGANLLVTHHPLMFAPRKDITESDYEGSLLCRIIRGRMGLIAAHTNLDLVCGGTNDVLAALCGLTNVAGEGACWRVGDLPEGTTLGSLASLLEQKLHTVVRICGQRAPEQPVRRLGLCTGAGSEYWEETAALGADVFVTGEVRHHHALAAADRGVVILEAGHFATEEPGIFALGDALQSRLNALQCPLRITRSVCGAYALPGCDQRR